MLTTTQLQVAIIALGGLMAHPRSSIAQQPSSPRIVSNPPRSSAPKLLRLGPATFDIGGPNDRTEREFSRGIFSGERLSDGSVVVTDRVRFQIFDSKGGLLQILGRAGSGPSEFRSVNGGELCHTRGDTLVAGDSKNGRFAIIHNRRVVRTVSAAGLGTSIAGCFDDGTFLVSSTQVTGPHYGIRIQRVRLDGARINEFQPFTFPKPSRVTGFLTPKVEAVGRRVYVGDPMTNEVRVYRLDGPLEMIIQSAEPTKRIPAARIDSAGPPLRGATHPQTYPKYHSIAVDGRSRLWVSDYWTGAGSPAQRVWTVFDTTGRLLGRLEVPNRINDLPAQVVGFGNSEVKIWYHDADGFPRLQFRPILGFDK